MLKSMFSGVSGIRNLQTKIDVISNNIANVNTTGYKQARVSFQNQFSETLRGASAPGASRGGTNPSQIGLGTMVGGVDSIMTQGTIQPTGKSTDLAISGEGFFILNNGEDLVYSRDGNFDFDRSGTLANPNTGYRVMGWKAKTNTDGKVSLNTMDQISTIEIPSGQIMAPRATSTISGVGNLNATTPRLSVGLSGTILDGGTPNPSYMQFTDAYGIQRTLKVTFNRPAADPALSLAYTVQAVKSLTDDTADPQVDVSMPGPNNFVKFSANGNPIAPSPSDFKLKITRTAIFGETTPPDYSMDVPVDAWELFQSSVGTGSLQAAVKTSKDSVPNYVLFGTKVIDSLGASHMINIKATHVANDSWRISLDYEDNTISRVDYKVGDDFLLDKTSDAPTKENFQAEVRFDLLSGRILSGGTPTYRVYFGNAGSSEITLDLTKLTSISGENTATAGQNGYGSGILNGFNIDGNGIITGSFSNGQNQQLAQLALANFNNPAGLSRGSDNHFTATNNSGDPMVGAAGKGGRGSIQSGALEMSNVDLASSFSELILAQRAFQSNSRLVTVSDEVLQEMMNLKR
ncbi:MAG: flagellar hook protein FlgE [Bacteroidota bacterium]